MNLIDARMAFTDCLGKLYAYADQQGLQLVQCEGLRTPMQAEWNATHCSVKESGFRCEKVFDDRVHKAGGHQFHPIGIRGSLHQVGLAQDVLIMRQLPNGAWAIDESDAGYRKLADYWKTLHPLARAGIDFHDPGHFSFTWEGRS